MDLLGSILSNMDAPPTSKVDKARQKSLKGECLYDLIHKYCTVFTKVYYMFKEIYSLKYTS